MSLIKKYIEEHEKNILYRMCLKKQEGNIPFHLRGEYLQSLEHSVANQMSERVFFLPVGLLNELFGQDRDFWQDLAKTVSAPDNHVYVAYLFGQPDGLNRLGLTGDADIPDTFTFTLLNKIRDSLLDDFALSYVSSDPAQSGRCAMAVMNRCLSLCLPYLNTKDENLLWGAFDNEVSLWAQNGRLFQDFSHTSGNWREFMRERELDGVTEAFEISDYLQGDEDTREHLKQKWLKDGESLHRVREQAQSWGNAGFLGLLDSLKTEKVFRSFPRHPTP